MTKEQTNVLDDMISTTIEPEEVNENNESIDDLLVKFNSFKTEDTRSASQLNKKFTLKGLDEVNELVATAMMQIDQFANNGKEEGLFGRASSKALAIFDPKSKWIGKWASNAKDQNEKETIQSKNIDEIITGVRDNIEKKKDEVSDLVYAVLDERARIIDRIKYYMDIDDKAMKIFERSEDNTKDQFTSQRLVTMAKGTIQQLTSSVNNDIDPLVMSAKISIEKIETILPSIESNLQSKLGFKTVQQQLSDLNSMTMTITDLSNVVDDTVTKDIQETTIQTLELLKNSGVNVKKIEGKIQRDQEFEKKLGSTIKSVQSSMNDEFNSMMDLNKKLSMNKDTANKKFISQYVENTSSITVSGD